MPHAQRRGDEVHDAPAGVNRWRRILLDPAVVVLGRGKKNRGAPWMNRQRQALLHDLPRQLRVIRLRHQLNALRQGADNHG